MADCVTSPLIFFFRLAPLLFCTWQHGNKPSRGAQVDEELENEEKEMLQKKGPEK